MPNVRINDLPVTSDMGNNDFVATDNGAQGTKKISYPNMASKVLDKLTTKTFSSLSTTQKNVPGAVNELKARVDNIVAPSGDPTLTELADIRVNFLGETFDTAGDAVRTSDMLASGFEELEYSVESVEDVKIAAINIERFVGGRIVFILNSAYNTLLPLNESGLIGLNNSATWTGAIQLDNDNSTSPTYPVSDYFYDYQEKVLSHANNTYRLLVTFSIREDIEYSYVGVIYVDAYSSDPKPDFVAYGGQATKTTAYFDTNNDGEVEIVYGSASDASRAMEAVNQAIEDMEDHMDDELGDLRNDVTCAFRSEDQEIDIESLTLVDGSYIKSDGSIGSNGSYQYCSNYVPIEKGWKSITSNRYIITLNGTEYAQAQTVFFYNASKNFISGVTTVSSGRIQTAVIPPNAKYLRANFSKYHTINFLKVNYDDINGLLGFVGRASGTFASQAVVTTSVILKANTDYYIVNNIITDCNINVFCESSSSYKQITAGLEWCHFKTGATGGAMKIYNYSGDLVDYDISVYERDSDAEKTTEVPEVYRVSLAANRGDYTSLTQCFIDLKDNIKPKIIYIDGGTYNIYTEYVNANVPVYSGSSPSTEYMDYNVWVPQNTHIIGLGKVVLSWQPDTTNNPEITTAQCQTVSPLNVRGTCIIENIDIICKNGRYCIHDDPLGIKAYAFSKRLYKNVRCFKKANERDENNVAYGYANTIGFGFDANTIYDFEGCEFHNESTGYAFYGHSRQTNGGTTLQKIQSPSIHVTDCVIDTQRDGYSTKLGNSGSSTNLEIQTAFRSCYFSGDIDVVDESGATGNNPNAFAVTLVRCGNISVRVYDQSNPYEPAIYGT